MEGARHNQHHVVNHVAIGAVIHELGQLLIRLPSLTPPRQKEATSCSTCLSTLEPLPSVPSPRNDNALPYL